MSRQSVLAAGLALLGLVACDQAVAPGAEATVPAGAAGAPATVAVPGTGAAAAAAAARPGAIVLAPEGLDIAGTGLEIGFGRAEQGAVKAVQKLMGRPPSSRQSRRDCAGGPLDAIHWDGGLTLFFRDGAFKGWAVRSPGFATARGLSVGDGPDELAALSGVRQTGAGLAVGGIAGALDGAGVVSRLWAGEVCA